MVLSARRIAATAALAALVNAGILARQSMPTLPSTPITFGFFTARFDPAGTFTLEGEGWPPFKGTWTMEAAAVVLSTPGVRNCEGQGRYRIGLDNGLVHFDVVSDDCEPRRMIVDRSTWRPVGAAKAIPTRTIARTGADRMPPLPAPASAAGSWPSFRGPDAAGTNGDDASARPVERHARREHSLAHRRFPVSATRARSSGDSASSSPAR